MEKSKKSIFFSVAISTIITAVLLGGATFWLINTRQQKFDRQVSSLRVQIEKFKQASSTAATIINDQNDELLETKFKLSLLQTWPDIDLNSVFTNPQDRKRVYFLSDNAIVKYDIGADTYFQKNGVIDIGEYSKHIFDLKLQADIVLKGVGIVDNKYIFAGTGVDNSPGPCFSPWFFWNLKSIDLTVAQPTMEPFTLPEDIKQSETQKMAECEKDSF